MRTLLHLNTPGSQSDRAAAFLGWRPKDNGEAFRAEIDAALPAPPRGDSRSLYHGSHFIDESIHPER